MPQGGDPETALANSRYKQVADWLDENRCGWRKYYATMPTPEIIIGSPEFYLYLDKNSIYVQKKGESILVRTLSNDERRLFLEMLFATDR